MSVSERISSLRQQLEALKQRIRQKQQQKEEEIAWETTGKTSTVRFNFQVQRRLRGHFGKIYALDWARDGTTLLSASQDGKLIIWNAYTENKRQVVSLKSPWVMSCAFEKETDRLVACGGLDNICSIYDVSSAGSVGGVALPNELVGHDGYLSSCKFLPGNKVLTSSGDSTCALWDIADGKGRKLQTFSDHSADVMRSVRLLSDTRTVLLLVYFHQCFACAVYHLTPRTLTCSHQAHATVPLKFGTSAATPALEHSQAT
jgi:guanine nucleotide-binding protein G(I)/G(S)/G(T) subunit beta-1